MLREVPSFERPREKALQYGIKSLSNIELLAIILRTGTKDLNVLELSKKILYGNENIGNLRNISIEELSKIKGVGNTKAITLLASIELGSRILEEQNKIIYFTNPTQIFNYYYPKVNNLTKEYLYALYFNTKGYLLKEVLITQGTINSSILDGKDILKWAIKLSATAIILVHNHPSGDSTPSLADIKATSNFVKQAKLMEIVVLDHIIIGNDYYSMKESCTHFKVF